MRKRLFVILLALGVFNADLRADEAAKVTEAVNEVSCGSKASGKSAAHVGTPVHDGQYLQTGVSSRAEMELPTSTVTRLGANTIFNYTANSNSVDLQQGSILFCKPKNATTLRLETAAVSAAITGTTGFVSVQGSGKKKTYIFGIIEGHANAMADGKPFPVNSGEIVEFKTGLPPFKYSFDLPRFVKSSGLLHKYKSTLSNQSQIDRAVADYQEDLSRGFIVPPRNGIDYSSDVPIFASAAYDSAHNSQGGKPSAAPPPPPPSTYRGGFSPSGSGP